VRSAQSERVAEKRRRDGGLDGGAAVLEGLPARRGGGRALQDGRRTHRKGEAAAASAGWLQADAVRQQEVQRNRRLRQKRLQGAGPLEFLARKLGQRCQILPHAGHQPRLQGPIQKGLQNFQPKLAYCCMYSKKRLKIFLPLFYHIILAPP
jgi:hypothetical protein